MTVLADFGELRPAEAKLVAWLQAGNRKVCEISNNVPDNASDNVTLRATFIRYLALGGCNACRLPETGLRVAGAYILGDDRNNEYTTGLDFDGATLPHDLALFDCHIPDPIILRSTKVKSLFLDGSDIKAAIEADRVQAEGGVFLRGAKVAGEVRLPGARVGGNLECDGAELRAKGDALNCDGAKINGVLFLRAGAKVSGCIDLTDTTFGAICDDPSCWPPELILDRCRYGAFQGNNAPTDAKSRLEWLALQKPQKYGLDFWPDPYEHCAKVLREMGHGGDAREILIEKERLQRKAQRDRVRSALTSARASAAREPRKAGINRHSDRVITEWIKLRRLQLWHTILSTFTGYGRRPQNAAWWGLGMWLVGFLVFANAAGHGAIKPNLPQIQLNPAWTSCAKDPRGQLDCFLNHPDAASYPRFNAAIYSADTLIPVVSLEMQSYWIPDDRTDRGMLARGYLWFHIAMGWALTLLAVAGFSGLIKTDNAK